MIFTNLRHFVITFFFTICTNQIFAQSPQDATSLKGYMKRITKDLGSDVMEQRVLGSVQLTATANYLSDEFQSIGLLPITGFQKYLDPFSMNLRGRLDTAYNVVGIVKGSELSSEYIIISAHFDVNDKVTSVFSDGKMVDISSEMIKLTGENDNASGVAMMLSLAKLLIADSVKPKRSVIFIAFSGQDLNNRGAEHFVNLFTYKSVLKFNINFDAVGLPEDKKLYFTKSKWSSFIPNVLKSVPKKSQSKIVLFEPIFNYGDEQSYELGLSQQFSEHKIFEQNSIPTSTFTTTSLAGMSGDKINESNKLNYTFMSHTAAILYQAIKPLMSQKTF
jgi:hypothetical protein